MGLAKAAKPVTCVTWGLAASLADPRNDAAIARRLAQGFGMPHKYFHLDFTDEPVRDVFARFLRAGEGRIEDFSGYTDGFKAWERLYGAGVAAILRGDCPGWGSPYDPIDETVARSINMHCTLVSDYPEGHLIHRLGLAAQRRPDALYQREAETLPQYRDRLYNDFELPTCMAAFNDVKCAYLEVVNPLLGRDVVRVTTGLPDEFRHLRVGFERLAASLVPGVPFADNQADEPPGVYLSRPSVRGEIMEELSSEAARRVFPEAALAGDHRRPRAPAQQHEVASSRTRQGPRAAQGGARHPPVAATEHEHAASGLPRVHRLPHAHDPAPGCRGARSARRADAQGALAVVHERRFDGSPAPGARRRPPARSP